jgi:NADH dehydrogenase [ubiquinone] 1 alpha subcomplex assembly factor 3
MASIFRSALATGRLTTSRPVRSLAAFHTSTPVRSLQNIFETAERPSLAITKFNDKGFHLTDGLVIPGGVVFVGGQVMLWDVDPPVGTGGGKGGIESAWKGWTKERFKVFESVSPRPGEYRGPFSVIGSTATGYNDPAVLSG